jgi:hypothetical protein
LENTEVSSNKQAKMAPFRPFPADFRRLSIEILYDRALGGPAKAGSRLRISPSFSACYATEQGESLPVISLNLRASNSFQAVEIKHFHESNPIAARPAFPDSRG